ncbi:MAG TPA: hypothetical protein VM012_03070 [Flavitalea sp.]|nr:hypothetical protein [Flavitalea sp.]
MYTKLLCFSTLFLISLACNKDKFQSKPTFTIKSINSDNIGPGQQLVVTLKFTDKEGDLAGARIGVQKVVPQCALSNFTDTNKYSISADVPASNNQQGEIDVIFPYIFINPFCTFNDTATFRFWVTDKAGNTSDTAASNTIVIRRS